MARGHRSVSVIRAPIAGKSPRRTGFTMTEKSLEQMGLRDLRAIARRRMPEEAWHHFNGAAETKATFYRNPRAFRKYLLRQRVYHDITDPDTSIELFGQIGRAHV